MEDKKDPLKDAQTATPDATNENLKEILKSLSLNQSNLSSLDKLLVIVLTKPDLNVDQQLVLLNELRKLKPPTDDRWIYRWIVWILGAAILTTVVFSITLVLNNKESNIPDGLLALASAAVGALASFLSPLSKSNQ